MEKILALLIMISLMACSGSQRTTSLDSPIEMESHLPSTEREFRAAWVASVANINWPSKAGLTVEEQKQEAIFMLDFLQENHFNAVILQVRPQCDALYASDLEPWSYYLTGTQGKAPEPYYDPLEFWIEEAHKRALEFHAWLNPYRAHHKSGGPVGEHSIVKTKPELVVFLESGYYWLDPSDPATQDHSYEVVMDIVQRYDVDGIHFDDYFYPYPSYNNNKDFPDEKNWQKYLESGGKLSRPDWRRQAVNQFIERLYKGIKATKKQVKFGLSPFGIWRPNNPSSIKGFDQYEKLYADAKLWLNEGWIDYFTPQLYWPINKEAQSFPVLLGWWAEQNHQNRHLWPGISLSRLNNYPPGDEAINQIMISRGMLPNSPGIVHWNLGSFLKSESLTSAVANGPYKKQALVPASNWLDQTLPVKPNFKAEIVSDSLRIEWSSLDSIKNYVLYAQYDSSWDYEILPSTSLKHKIPIYRWQDKELIVLNQYAVSSVDLFGNESNIEIQDISEEVLYSLPQIGELYPLVVEEEAKGKIHPIWLSKEVQDVDKAMSDILKINYNLLIIDASFKSRMKDIIKKAHENDMKVFLNVEDTVSFVEESLKWNFDGILFRKTIPSRKQLLRILIEKPSMLFAIVSGDSFGNLLNEGYLDLVLQYLIYYKEGTKMTKNRQRFAFPLTQKLISPEQIFALDISDFQLDDTTKKKISIHGDKLAPDENGWVYFTHKDDTIKLSIDKETFTLDSKEWAIPNRYKLNKDGSITRAESWIEWRKYPDQITTNASFDLLAKSSPDARAFINDKELKVYKTGIFFDKVEFTEGANRISSKTISAKGDTSHYSMDIYYSKKIGEKKAFPFWIDSSSVNPAHDMELTSKDVVYIQFEGSKGQEAMIEILPSGDYFACSREDKEWSSVYSANIPLDQLKDPGKYRILIRMNGNTLFPIEQLLSIKKASDFPFLRTTKDHSRLTYNLGPVRLGGPVRTELEKGTILQSNGVIGDYYRIKLNETEEGMIHKENIEILADDFHLSPYYITNMSARPTENADILSIPYLNPVPYEIIPQPGQKRIVIRLFGVKTSSTWISHRSGLKIIKNISWQQSDPSTYEVIVNLQSDRIWGYELIRAEKTLQLKIKYPPELMSSAKYPLKGLKIALEAGHGGESTGAIGLAGTVEKDINLLLALELEGMLIKKGANVLQVRPDDREISLLDKRKIVEESGCNIFVSIHANAAGGGYLRVSGTSTYYQNDFWAPLAQMIYDRLLETGLPEFGVVGSFNYTPIRTSTLPAILVEQAFMTHAEDEEKMTDPEFRQLMAEKILLGILDFIQFMEEK